MLKHLPLPDLTLLFTPIVLTLLPGIFAALVSVLPVRGSQLGQAQRLFRLSSPHTFRAWPASKTPGWLVPHGLSHSASRPEG